MQNQNLTQTYLGLKQQSNTSKFKYNEHKNLTKSKEAPSYGEGISLSENKWTRDRNPQDGKIGLPKQDQAIQDILGYPVIQVIFDEQGDVILDIGDLITYQAVERAIKANVFKNLLEAVYIKK